MTIIRCIVPFATDETVPGIGHQRVVSSATVQCISFDPAIDQIVAIATLQNVDVKFSDQSIVVIAPDQVLDADEGVTFGVAARSCSGRERDIDPGSRRRIIRRVVPLATIKVISAGKSDEDIVPEATKQSVVAVIANQSIVVIRTCQVLYPEQSVAFRVSPSAHRPIKGNADTNVRAAVVSGVDPGPAVDQVGSVRSLQDIVAAITDQRVVMRGTDKDLDPGQDVTFRRTARTCRAAQSDIHGRERRLVNDRVDSRTALKGVGFVIANERVVERRTDDGFDAVECIARGMSTLLR